MKKISMLFAILFVLTALISGCGKETASEPAKATPKTAVSKEPVTVKLGIFKNVTHAAGYVALENGYFQKNFGDNVKIEVTSFDNGSEFSTALATGAIDLGFVGPGPSTNQYVKSKNFKVISGSNNGGAVLAVGKESGINTVKDLVGKVVAIPTKGSTNEISLRLLLKQEGLKVTTDISGVQIIARAPAETLVALRQKEVDATLIPEPWGTQIEEQGVGKVLVGWDKIPPNNGNYPLTILVASDKFLAEHRDLAKGAVKANNEAIQFIKTNEEKSYELINNQLKKLSGKGMDNKLIKAALAHLNLTTDVSRPALEEMAKVSIEAGYIKELKVEQLDLSKFIDLSILEEVKAGK
ncbi:ABC transporter substrate-binding protein [Paenibacillus sp. KN14-4R]|uniref:ABC transporter substrate-binding protein n=1 Tax=Paenibacillus sp. KN14-4R TaxID=3445773 RepID=UPI003FA04C42